MNYWVECEGFFDDWDLVGRFWKGGKWGGKTPPKKPLNQSPPTTQVIPPHTNHTKKNKKDQSHQIIKGRKNKEILVDFVSVVRVRPRTSKGHHRPVIASNFHSLPFRHEIVPLRSRKTQTKRQKKKKKPTTYHTRNKRRRRRG